MWKWYMFLHPDWMSMLCVMRCFYCQYISLSRFLYCLFFPQILVKKGFLFNICILGSVKTGWSPQFASNKVLVKLFQQRLKPLPDVFGYKTECNTIKASRSDSLFCTIHHFETTNTCNRHTRKSYKHFCLCPTWFVWSILRPLVSDWTGGTYSKCSLLFRLILSKLCVLVLVICKVTANKTWELGFVHQFIITDWGGSGFYWNSSVNLCQVKTYNPILQNPWITFSEGLFMSNANILLKF